MRASFSAFALALCASLTAIAQTAPAPQPHRNVYRSGGDVRSTVPVSGDFMAAAGRVVVDQRVGGDVMVAAGSVEVRAPVGDDLRAVGGSVAVEDQVGGDLFAAGADVTVRPRAVVAGAADLRGASVTVRGTIAGGLAAHGQTVLVDGEVRGPARLVAERIELGPNARIAGALTYTAKDFVRAAGAKVVGPVTQVAADAPAPGTPREPPAGFGGRGMVAPFVGLFACAALLLLLLPDFSDAAALRLLSAPAASLGAGLLVTLLVPALVVLLFATLLGIPMGLLVLASYPVVLLAGFVVGVLCVANLLAAAMRRPAPATPGHRMGRFALALLLVLLAGLVPFAGAALLVLLAIAGLGAAVLELAGRRRGGRGRATAVAAPHHELQPS